MDQKDIEKKLDNPGDWQISQSVLKAKFKFDDFVSAFAFMTEVAIQAEKLNHHPTWTNTYNTVEISLTTHDQDDNVTEKDIKLANHISDVYEKFR